MARKYKQRNRKQKHINTTIFQSNASKRHVKQVNMHSGTIPCISHMQTPAYPNLIYIASTVKGTVEEILK